MDKYYFYTHLEDEFSCRRVMAMLDGKLPLTNPSHFNDPFDSRLRFKPDFTEEDARKYLGWDSSESPVLRKFRRFQNPMPSALSKKEQEIFRRWTAFSVSEVADSLLMWAHYAAQHKGICIELEYDTGQKPETALFDKIRYTTHYPQDIRVSIDSGLDRASLETLLLTKSIDWHYEREWRFAIQDAPQEDDYPGDKKFDGVINSPFKVTGVCYGMRFPDEKTRELLYQSDASPQTYSKAGIIKLIGGLKDISVFKGKLKAGEFALEHGFCSSKCGDALRILQKADKLVIEGLSTTEAVRKGAFYLTEKDERVRFKGV